MPVFRPELIRRRREALRISRERLAVDLDRSSVSVFRWETGRAVPSADQVGRIAERLDCCVDDFYSEVEK